MYLKSSIQTSSIDYIKQYPYNTKNKSNTPVQYAKKIW